VRFLEIIQGHIWKEAEGRRMYAKMFPIFVQSELLLESLVRLVDVWGGGRGAPFLCVLRTLAFQIKEDVVYSGDSLNPSIALYPHSR